MRSRFRAPGVNAALLGLLLIAPARADVRFVELVSTDPVRIAPPIEPLGAETLAVELRGLDQPDLVLRVLSYADADANGRFSAAEASTLAEDRLEDLRDRLIEGGGGSLLLPLAREAIAGQAELEAIVFDAERSAVGPAARLTLDSTVAERGGWLFEMGRNLLSRALRIRDTVRSDGQEVKTLYRLTAGSSEPLATFEAPISAIATTPSGGRIAVVAAGSVWLASGSVQPTAVYSATEPIVGLGFADELTLVVGHPDAWVVLDPRSPGQARRCPVSDLGIGGLLAARRSGDAVRLVVEAAPGAGRSAGDVWELGCGGETPQRLASDSRYRFLGSLAGDTLYVFGNNPEPGIYGVNSVTGEATAILASDSPVFAVATASEAVFYAGVDPVDP